MDDLSIRVVLPMLSLVLPEPSLLLLRLNLVLPGLALGFPVLSCVMPSLNLVLPGLTFRFPVVTFILLFSIAEQTYSQILGTFFSIACLNFVLPELPHPKKLGLEEPQRGATGFFSPVWPCFFQTSRGLNLVWPACKMDFLALRLLPLELGSAWLGEPPCRRKRLRI